MVLTERTAEKPCRHFRLGQRIRHFGARFVTIAVMITGATSVAIAQSDKVIALKTPQSSANSPGTTNQGTRAPRRHFRLKNPANVSNKQAENIYANLRKSMARGYASSGLKPAKSYQKWQRYNTVPFQSAAHGRRLVNHYANAKAHAYGKYENAGILPVGSIVAKDNITVMDENKIYAGALLLMEKMPSGFNYVSGDWRYTMVMPDGSVFGITNGAGSAKVKFCIGCHLAVEHQDHLHFPPDKYRRP